MKKTLKLTTDNRFRTKEGCLEEADRILKEGLIDNMRKQQIARELYFHSKAHHLCMKSGKLRWVKEHSDPIDLNDGGDTRFRRMVYYVVWKLL